jgi:hypothetical protein
VIILENFRGEGEEEFWVYSFRTDDHSASSEEDIVLLANLQAARYIWRKQGFSDDHSVD